MDLGAGVRDYDDVGWAREMLCMAKLGRSLAGLLAAWNEPRDQSLWVACFVQTNQNHSVPPSRLFKYLSSEM